MSITTDQISQAIEVARMRGGRTTVSQCFAEMGGCVTGARKVLNRAVELEFMTVTKCARVESVYRLTDKPLSELQEPSAGLIARFEELLSAWGIPLTAPAGWKGRVHQRFLKYQM